MDKDFVEAHVTKIAQNKFFRQQLLNAPKATLEAEYGCKIPDDVKIQVIEATPDTVHLLLPTPDSPLDESCERVADMLYPKAGICGWLIPSEKLKWVLRNMRRAWINKVTGSSS